MMTLPPPSPPPIADTLKLAQTEALRLCGDEDGVVEGRCPAISGRRKFAARVPAGPSA